jgi:hypothetical protein
VTPSKKAHRKKYSKTQKRGIPFAMREGEKKGKKERTSG